MSTYPMQELVRLWRLGQLTHAQLIGQLLLYAQQVLARQATSQAQIATLREDLRIMKLSRTQHKENN